MGAVGVGVSVRLACAEKAWICEDVMCAMWFHFSCHHCRYLSVLTLSSPHLSTRHIRELFYFSADRGREI